MVLRFSQISLPKLELDSIVRQPLLYNGQTISREDSLDYLREKRGGTNGWAHVHWFDANNHRGTKIILQDVNGTDMDAIYVHNTVHNHPTRCIKDCGVSHVMVNHSHIRKKEYPHQSNMRPDVVEGGGGLVGPSHESPFREKLLCKMCTHDMTGASTIPVISYPKYFTSYRA